MILIAGLGNPGKKYDGTRHNMGFEVADRLINRHNIPQDTECRFDVIAVYGSGKVEWIKNAFGGLA